MRRALLVLLAASGTALAQPSDTKALAEQLFNQARELVKANNFAEACPKFEASLRYDPTIGTRLNLASCYEHVGKIASAWGMYRDTGELADKSGDTKRRDFARKAASALEPRIPKLTVTAPPTAPAGLMVDRDGTPIDPGAFGVALYVDPGKHHITAKAPGFDPIEHDVTLAEGKAETYAIPDLKASPVAVVVAPTKVEPPPRIVHDEVEPSHLQRNLGLGVGIGGLVLAGVGIGFGAKASGKYSDAKTLCGSDLACAPADYAKGQQTIKDARSAATLSTVFVIVGGVAVAGGVVLWVLAPKRHASDSTVGIVPVVDAQQAGFAAIGHF